MYSVARLSGSPPVAPPLIPRSPPLIPRSPLLPPRCSDRTYRRLQRALPLGQLASSSPPALPDGKSIFASARSSSFSVVQMEILHPVVSPPLPPFRWKVIRGKEEAHAPFFSNHALSPFFSMPSFLWCPAGWHTPSSAPPPASGRPLPQRRGAVRRRCRTARLRPGTSSTRFPLPALSRSTRCWIRARPGGCVAAAVKRPSPFPTTWPEGQMLPVGSALVSGELAVLPPPPPPLPALLLAPEKIRGPDPMRWWPGGRGELLSTASSAEWFPRPPLLAGGALPGAGDLAEPAEEAEVVAGCSGAATPYWRPKIHEDARLAIWATVWDIIRRFDCPQVNKHFIRNYMLRLDPNVDEVLRLLLPPSCPWLASPLMESMDVAIFNFVSSSSSSGFVCDSHVCSVRLVAGSIMKQLSSVVKWLWAVSPLHGPKLHENFIHHKYVLYCSVGDRDVDSGSVGVQVIEDLYRSYSSLTFGVGTVLNA